MGQFPVPLMGDIAAQESIIGIARQKFDALAGITALRTDARQQIELYLSEIWG